MKIFISQNKTIKKIIIILFWIGVWQILSTLVGKEVFLPSFPRVVRALISEATSPDFWSAVLFSLLRVISGFLIGILFAIVFAVACCRYRVINELLSPLMSVIRSTPVASFIMLVYLFIDRSNVPAFISFLMVLPVVWGSLVLSYNNTPKKLLNYCKIYNITGLKKLRYLYVPLAAPYFVSSSMTSLGLAWKAGIAAEVLCTPPDSLGRGIYFSKVYLETPELYAYTITVILLSVVLEWAVKLILNKFKPVNANGEEKNDN